MEIMDLKSFIEEMDGDYDDVNMIVTEFTHCVELQIPLMLSLFNSSDFMTLSREAHSIKGGARNIMAPAMEFAAEDLEKSSKNADSELSLKNIHNIEIEFIKFKKYISENLFINH